MNLPWTASTDFHFSALRRQRITAFIDTMGDFICAASGALVGMFAVAFYRNGVIGKNKKEVRARLMREKEEEKLKRQLLDEYLKAHNDNNI